ncbi:MAG TPA: M67 family metallopeptidase [Vicinamibacterales bacterium]
MRISPAARTTIERHAIEAYPHECCGALYGDPDEGTIAEALPLPNTTAEGPRRRFLIQPGDYRAAEAHARTSGRAFIGFYHSHPDHPARPSQHDLDHAWPNMIYTITSVVQAEVKETTAWRLKEDRSAFERVPIVEG